MSELVSSNIEVVTRPTAEQQAVACLTTKADAAIAAGYSTELQFVGGADYLAMQAGTGEADRLSRMSDRQGPTIYNLYLPHPDGLHRGSYTWQWQRGGDDCKALVTGPYADPQNGQVVASKQVLLLATLAYRDLLHFIRSAARAAEQADAERLHAEQAAVYPPRAQSSISRLVGRAATHLRLATNPVTSVILKRDETRT